jgi:hypothetical protein
MASIKFSALFVGYKTEKLHRFSAAVFQLMLLVWRNEDGISGFELLFFFSANSNPLAFQYEDFMFPVVGVEWAVSSSLHLEKSHGKVFGSSLLGYEPSDFQFSASAFSVFRFNVGVMEDFQFVHLSGFSVQSGILVVCLAGGFCVGDVYRKTY